MFKSRISWQVAMLSLAGTAVPGVVLAQQGVLEEIVVTTEIQSYRGGVPLEDTAQSVQIMDDKLLADIGVTELSSALDLSGSIARQNNFGGVWDAFAIRGFAGDENVPSGYLVNGFAAGRGFSGIRDAANIQRVEVLKGPGSALFGRSEPGGTINIVTKKPQFEEAGYIQASAGSYDSYRVEGDYTNALTDTIAYRINGSYEDSESFRDTVTNEKLALTPSIVWIPTDSTKFSYELEVVEQEAPFDRGVVAINDELGTVDTETFLGEPADGDMQIEATGHQILMEHDLTETWTLIGALGYRESSVEGYSSDPELSSGRQLLFTDGETLNRQRRHRDYDTEDKSARAEISGELSTGSLIHNLLIGADTYDFQISAFQDRWRVGWGSGDTTYTINVFDPVYGGPQPIPTPMSYKVEDQKAWGVYIQDQIDLSQNWRMTLGVRFDDFSQEITQVLNGDVSKQSQTEVNPRFGLVYEPTDFTQFYLSYSEGFRPNTGSNWANEAFEPEKSKSYEVGVKMHSEDGRLSSTIALFRAEKSNILTSDPVHSGFSEALGEAESSGVEVDVSGELAENLFLWFSYAYVDAETTNEMINPDWGVTVPAGTPLVNIPEHSASLSLTKDFQIGDNQSNAGFSLRYVDERSGDTINPEYVLPDYTLVKLFGSYQVTPKLDLRVEVDNLFDEEYYPSSYSAMWTMPGEPRTYAIKGRYEF